MSITQVKPFVTFLDKLNNSNHEISERDLRDRERHWYALDIPGQDLLMSCRHVMNCANESCMIEIRLYYINLSWITTQTGCKLMCSMINSVCRASASGLGK